MKKLIGFIIVIICAAVCSGTAHAQISGDVTLNLPLPTGDFADIAKVGYGAGVDAFIGLPMIPIKLGGRVAYNRFGVNDDFDDGGSSTIEILPSARYSIGLPMELLSVFAQIGLGMYKWETETENGNGKEENDGTDFGICVGGGVSGGLSGTMSFVVMPLYHIVMTDDDNLTYVSLNVGIRF